MANWLKCEVHFATLTLAKPSFQPLKILYIQQGKIPTPDPQNRAKVNQTRFPPTLIASKKQKPRKIYISLGLYCLMATCL